MTAKKISLKPKARTAQDTAAMNAWVAQGAETQTLVAKPAAVEKEPMKRLSIDLPASVHKQLMVYCATNGTKAAQVVRTLIEQTIHNS